MRLRAKARWRLACRRLRSAARYVRPYLSAIIIASLAALLLASEAGRLYHKRQAADYRVLWNKERIARLGGFIDRMDELEARIAALPERGATREYKNRLADIRRNFDDSVRREAGAPVACPSPAMRATPAPARATGAAEMTCPASAAEVERLRESERRLIELQAWVRQHTGG